jgi:hypothetical protein
LNGTYVSPATAVRAVTGEGQEVDRLLADLERAERKIEGLKQVAETRRLRYQRAEAELDRLRRAWPRRTLRFGLQAIGLGRLSAFCLFIGYPRSGHSLIGALLDAHPDAAIAHEINVLALIAGNGMDRDELFRTLLRVSESDAGRKLGRRATGYSYAVPGQWQGYVRELRVIGAKAGEKTTRWLGRDPGELTKLRRLVRAPVRLVHVTRNPYDSIARMAATTKGGQPERTLANAIDFLRRLARINDRLIRSGKVDILTIRHELFVRDPRADLLRLAEFLEIDRDPAWLKACAQIVFPTPQRARDAVAWTDDERAAVEEITPSSPGTHGRATNDDVSA